MFKFLSILVLILSHRYIIFTDFGLVNGFIRIFSSFQKYFFIKVFNKSVDLHFILCYIIYVANIGVWLSLVERFVRDEEVACSNLVTPTIRPLILWISGFFISLQEDACDHCSCLSPLLSPGYIYPRNSCPNTEAFWHRCPDPLYSC